MDILWELFSNLPQQGPGNDESTLRALSLIPDLPSKPAILDVGCGSGRQTIALARRTGGRITAVDIHQPFLDDLMTRAEQAGVSGQLTAVKRSMSEMEFDEASFDLIWSEGALYIMGFEHGLSYCKRFLKPGGFVSVSEIAWLTDEIHPEAKKFFDEEYPEMKTIAQNMEIIEKLDYRLVTSFRLPDYAWFVDYYYPVEQRIETMREKYEGNKEAIEFLDRSQLEIEIFRHYSNSYGYIFYIMQLPE